MHGVWIIHRDIKPDNVYLRDGRLVLGDFGITKLALDQKGSDASKFQPDFAPRDLASSTLWGPAEDIFQVGLLAATLLSGEIWWNDVVSARAIAGLDASDAFKSWIWHATGARSKRYWHADDALDALSSLRRVDVAPGRAPRTLRDQAVVFTGRLDGLTRARRWPGPGRSGAHPQTRLTDATTVVVVGRDGEPRGPEDVRRPGAAAHRSADPGDLRGAVRAAHRAAPSDGSGRPRRAGPGARRGHRRPGPPAGRWW